MAFTKQTGAAVDTAKFTKLATATTLVYCDNTVNSGANPTAIAQFTSGNAAKALGTVNLTTGLGGASFAAAGRVLTITPPSTGIVLGTGTIGCIVIHDGTNILHIDLPGTTITGNSSATWNPAAYTITESDAA